MTYKILTEIHHDDVGENSPALQQMEIQLTTAIAALARLRAPAAATPGRFVGGIIGQFERTARANQVAECERAIDMLKKKIAKMGGTADATGRVTQAGRRALVAYDHTLHEQGLTRVQIIGGLLYWPDGRTRVDTTAIRNAYATDDGYAIYVLSAQGNFHVSDQEVGRRHHSSLLAGVPVAGAGEIRVQNGVITGLTNRSGHYLPSIDHFLQVIHHLQKRTVDLDQFARITYVYEAGPGDHFNPPGSVTRFLGTFNLDNDSYDWNNLLYAYKALLLDATLLAHQGWEYRHGALARPGVYKIGTNEMVPHREVRHFLKGRGAQYVQPTSDDHFSPLNPSKPAARPRPAP